MEERDHAERPGAQPQARPAREQADRRRCEHRDHQGDRQVEPWIAK